MAALVDDPRETGKDAQRDLEEGRFSVLVTQTFLKATATERYAITELDIGESWARNAPNLLVRLMAKYDIVSNLLHKAEDHVQDAAHCADSLKQTHPMMAAGLTHVAHGLGKMKLNLEQSATMYFDAVRQVM